MGVVKVEPGHCAACCSPTVAKKLEYAAESVSGNLVAFAEDGSSLLYNRCY